MYSVEIILYHLSNNDVDEILFENGVLAGHKRMEVLSKDVEKSAVHSLSM